MRARLTFPGAVVLPAFLAGPVAAGPLLFGLAGIEALMKGDGFLQPYEASRPKRARS